MGGSYAKSRVEECSLAALQKWEQAKTALNRVASKTPEDQFHVNERVWLEGRNLALPYQTLKLAPRRYGPLLITTQVLLVTYELTLPLAWTIHDIFHASLLTTPYHETDQHGSNHMRPHLT